MSEGGGGKKVGGAGYQKGANIVSRRITTMQPGQRYSPGVVPN